MVWPYEVYPLYVPVGFVDSENTSGLFYRRTEMAVQSPNLSPVRIGKNTELPLRIDLLSFA